MPRFLLTLLLTASAAVSISAHDAGHRMSPLENLSMGHKHHGKHNSKHHHQKPAHRHAREHGGQRTGHRRDAAMDGNWNLATRGVSGVSAQQLAVVDDDHAIIFDKVEHNPIKTKNGNNAWGALYKFSDASVRPMELTSNSFCAGGGFLGNGTMASLGGNDARSDPNGYRWFNNTDGRQSVRLFTPCPKSETCQPYEDIKVHALIRPRWYPTTVRMLDGSMLIVGGCTFGGFTNDASQNEASYEYFPRKGKTVIPSQFLKDTLTANLFPHVIAIPSGQVFIAANTKAMLWDPVKNIEQRLPDLPNGVRVCYPFSGSALLLPLTPENNYTPEVLICGGSTIDDTTPPANLTTQIPASKQCVRMVLTKKGIKAGWAVESMPLARHMHSMALLPTGQVVIVNGAQTGVSSYHSVQKQVGYSNADHPTFQPLLYDPAAAVGSRFSSKNMPTSSIARMYHSVAVLTPNGDVMISGSNPNGDIMIGTPYPTQYEVEILSPPYSAMSRASITSLPVRVTFDKTFTVKVKLPSSSTSALDFFATPKITAVLADPGFSTHGVQMNARLVKLVVTKAKISGSTATLTIESPPSAGVYPPGYGWLYVLVDGVPSAGKRMLVGPGTVPKAY